MQPALEARVKGIHVATRDGGVQASLGGESVWLDDDDIKALINALSVADRLANLGL